LAAAAFSAFFFSSFFRFSISIAASCASSSAMSFFPLPAFPAGFFLGLAPAAMASSCVRDTGA